MAFVTNSFSMKSENPLEGCAVGLTTNSLCFDLRFALSINWEKIDFDGRGFENVGLVR